MEKKIITIAGEPISPGLAQGPAFVFQDIFDRDFQDSAIPNERVEQEHARLETAIEDVLRDLQVAAVRVEEDLGSAMADIFRAHEEMLRDVCLTNEIRGEIEKELINVEDALQRVFRRWERKFRSMDSEIFRQRGDDVVDLGRRLLRSLAGIRAHSLENMPAGSILVARRLLPSDTTYLPRRSTQAIVVEEGGPVSHCALLTRQMGIPGVTQVPQLLEHVATGELLLVDALQGVVTIAPDEATRLQFNERMTTHAAASTRARKRSREPAVTLDGVPVSVMANIGSRGDAELAATHGADGVGLFRTEVFFLSRTMLPTEDELVRGIADVIAPLAGRPIGVRLLDIGGDKPLPYLPLAAEDNPFLGRRGVRLLLAFPALLNVQLRVLLRIAQDHDIRIIVPMVTVPDDMERVRAALEQAGTELGLPALPRLGAMIETPAAALCVEAIAAVSDFLQIGTNDLTQYTMAASRENAFVSRYFKDDHPAVLQLVERVARLSDRFPVGVCGELAGRTDRIEAILRTGIRLLSVAPPLLPAVKDAVRNARVRAGA